ncbi:MAG: hypothetical protein JNM31_14240 [Flavobacteriales bacterium]|nr:hypothetical protein [Flavobacteriales bacterium]
MAEPRDTDLRHLFQQAGYHDPSRDLTSRIMARVAVTPMMQPSVVRPLIGKWGWVAIGTAMAGLLVYALISAPAGIDPNGGLVKQLMPTFQLPQGAWPVWLMAASGCLFLLAVVDRKLARKSAQH